jgi:hypothetical protein
VAFPLFSQVVRHCQNILDFGLLFRLVEKNGEECARVTAWRFAAYNTSTQSEELGRCSEVCGIKATAV